MYSTNSAKSDESLHGLAHICCKLVTYLGMIHTGGVKLCDDGDAAAGAGAAGVGPGAESAAADGAARRGRLLRLPAARLHRRQHHRLRRLGAHHGAGKPSSTFDVQSFLPSPICLHLVLICTYYFGPLCGDVIF